MPSRALAILMASMLSLSLAASGHAFILFFATGVPFAPEEGVAETGVTVATFVHSDTALTAGNFTATIDWGDGSTSPGTVTGSNGSFTVTGTHTFVEEVLPPADLAMTVTIHDTANNLNAIADVHITVADAPLSDGDPVAIGAPATFTGVGGNNTSVTPGSANAAFTAFAAAIGGVNNGAVAAPQAGGFRTINWDGVALDGTDFGGNTIVIDPNHVVGIPRDRFQSRGVFFEEIYAVSGPAGPTDPSTFSTVNPSVTSLFPAFSPTKTFAMFNDNGIGFSFVVPSVSTAAPVSTLTSGFGAIFRNVEIPNSTSIEFFNGNRSLAKAFVPAGSAGQAEFLGVLFATPIVSRIEITCGTDVLFRFDGTTFGASATDNPGTGHNLVVTDDFVYPEPVAPVSVQPSIAVTARTAFTGPVVIFNDIDPAGNARDFTARIDWGDGHVSPGTITANGNGGFTVSGSNTFTAPGSFSVTVDVADLGGSTLSLTNTAVVVAPTTILAVAGDRGATPEVLVLDGTTKAPALLPIQAFETKFKGGVRVAVGDVNGDGMPDVVAARGPGGASEVRVFDGTNGQPFAGSLGSFAPYPTSFHGGVFVAAGDVDGDGKADVIVAPGGGSPPQVDVFSGADGTLLASFLGGDPSFKKGVTVAAADVNGDGTVDIITGAGPGGSGLVRVFDGVTRTPLASPLGSFLAFDPTFKGGITVAAADVDGDGHADIIVGATSGVPEVKVFSGADGSLKAAFLALNVGFKGGVRVAAADVDADASPDVVTAPGKGGGAEVRAFDGHTFFGIQFFGVGSLSRSGALWVAAGR